MRIVTFQSAEEGFYPHIMRRLPARGLRQIIHAGQLSFLSRSFAQAVRSVMVGAQFPVSALKNKLGELL